MAPSSERAPETMSNPELALAEAFVEESDRHVFLTGKAGTGKTTFLHTLRQKSHKRMIVTAPTGVAAINARGVTLHSFFQLPLGPWVPGQEALAEERSHRFSKEKRRLVESLDLLVIDEISMVRADTLDGVDAALRRLRRNDLPFGGVQLLMIGDLGQLPPIVKDDEWRILGQYHDTPFFFSSRALAQTRWVPLELKKVYRQTDSRFIELLNRVREGRLDRSTLELLHTRYQPDFAPPEGEGWITLASHNRTVDDLNQSRLGRLAGKSRRFVAEVEGDFPRSSSPAPQELELKVGAQVLFVRNDPSPEKLYFNGKIGKVTRLGRGKVQVRCPGDKKDIAVEPATWTNRTYHLDDETGEIREVQTGSFLQLPLKLAWAITIHKSQGLTFERAVIDAGSAFAAGQVYVALSRCKSMEGLVLTSSIAVRNIRSDEAVRRFLAEIAAAPPDQMTLETARFEYRWRVLRDVFGLDSLRQSTVRLLDLLRENTKVLRLFGVDNLEELVAELERTIFGVSEAFLRELQHHAARHFARRAGPTTDSELLDRLGKASEYFRKEIESRLTPLVRLRFETDNRDLERRIEKALERTAREVAGALAALDACAGEWSPSQVLRARTAAMRKVEQERPKRGESSRAPDPDLEAASFENGELLERLLAWRTERARDEGVAEYRILHQKLVLEIARALPQSRTALRRIHGVGKKTVQRYGTDLIERVVAYCRERETELQGSTPHRSHSVH